MPSVWSCNEWDQLEEVIVGNPLNGGFSADQRSLPSTDRSLDEIPREDFSAADH
jgi:hypothetical protein